MAWHGLSVGGVLIKHTHTDNANKTTKQLSGWLQSKLAILTHIYIDQLINSKSRYSNVRHVAVQVQINLDNCDCEMTQNLNSSVKLEKSRFHHTTHNILSSINVSSRKSDSRDLCFKR